MHVIHLYNLTPHNTLHRRGEDIPIPHHLYMSDTTNRLQRLYDQLLPFGLPCHVVDTRDHIPKLDNRASAGIIVGVGDSTLFYKVLQYLPTPRISIVRHIQVSATHYDKYFQLVGLRCAADTTATATTTDAHASTSHAVMKATPGPSRVITDPHYITQMWCVIRTYPFDHPLVGEEAMDTATRADIEMCRRQVAGLRNGIYHHTNKVWPLPTCDVSTNTTNYTTHLTHDTQHAETSQHGGNFSTAGAAEVSAPHAAPIQATVEVQSYPRPDRRCRTIQPGPTIPVLSPQRLRQEPGRGTQGLRRDFGRRVSIRTLQERRHRQARTEEPEAAPGHCSGRAHSELLRHQLGHSCEPPALGTCYTLSEVFSVTGIPSYAHTDIGNALTEPTPTSPTAFKHDNHLYVCDDAGVKRDFVENSDEPTLAQAKKRPDFALFERAMLDEKHSLEEHHVFELVERPIDKVLKGRWVFKIKRNPDHSIDRYKARYVAKGFLQEYGVNYYDTWAPTAHFATVRLLFARAAIEDLEVRHIDIKCAFLNGDLEEDVYLEQPPHLTDGTNRVWKLKKAIYGLKQAGRQWHHKLSDCLLANGYKRANHDPALFIDQHNQQHALIMWVDDIFILGTTDVNNKAAQRILKDFEGRDLGEAKHLLGMEVLRDWKTKTIQLSQKHMIEDKLEQFGLQQTRSVSTPLVPNQTVQPDPHHKRGKKITEDAAGQHQRTHDSQQLDKEDHERYMSIVGSLQYLAIVTRPDIAFAASALARYMNNPTRFLLKSAERTLRYLGHTKNLTLTYYGDGKSSDNVMLLGYSDADYAGCTATARSTSGMVITYQGLPIYWRSKRQPIVTVSTAESELVALTETALQTQWLHMLLEEDFRFNVQNKLLCDNRATTRIAEDPICSTKTRHIEVRYKKVQEYVDNKKTEVEWIPTSKQKADAFTKALGRTKLIESREQLCLLPFTQ